MDKAMTDTTYHLAKHDSARIGMLTASVSRAAGGIYDAVRWLSRELNADNYYHVQVFGLMDEFTETDMPGWGTVPLSVFTLKGPRSFGYSPELFPALQSAKLDLLHIHALWMYPSIASFNLAKFSKNPYIISPHGMLDKWSLRNASWKKHLARLLYENKHLEGAACLQAASFSEADSFREIGLKNPICVIPNGIHFPENSLADKQPDWKKDRKSDV